MSDQLLVTHCAPTLAGLKTAKLFTCCSCSLPVQKMIDQWNRTLNSKGVFVYLARNHSGRALIYVYRKSRLEKDLSSPNVRTFLNVCGYHCTDIPEMLAQLSHRLENNCEFPHEIGVFLGYPISDVIGFIKNKGRNCKCIGCWKVYTDEVAAQRLFDQYKHCTDIYCQKLAQGFSILRLTVAA